MNFQFFESIGSPLSTNIMLFGVIWYGTSISSEPLYVAFHDEEWGVPIHDDRMLFELLTLSQALGQLTWPSILSKREEFRYAAQN